MGSRHFNPRSPCGERQFGFFLIRSLSYFNPRSPCGERHETWRKEESKVPISIHAPLAGSDSTPTGMRLFPTYFNPRSPCGERQVSFAEREQWVVFQSTLPLRGATVWAGGPGCLRDFNPRSPCGERRLQSPWTVQMSPISLHAPLAGSDQFIVY